MTVTIPDPEVRALGTVQQLADDYAGRAKAPRTVRAYATVAQPRDLHKQHAAAGPQAVALALGLPP